MAPSIIETETAHSEPQTQKLKVARPLEPTGALDKFESFEVTPIIGTEFPNVQVVDLLNAPNADDLLRDLAITSMLPSHLPTFVPTNPNTPQSPNAASSSSAPKTL